MCLRTYFSCQPLNGNTPQIILQRITPKVQISLACDNFLPCNIQGDWKAKGTCSSQALYPSFIIEDCHSMMLSVHNLPKMIIFQCNSFNASSSIFRMTRASYYIKKPLLSITSVRVVIAPFQYRKATLPSSSMTTSKTKVTKGCLISLSTWISRSSLLMRCIMRSRLVDLSQALYYVQIWVCLRGLSGLYWYLPPIICCCAFIMLYGLYNYFFLLDL